MRQCLLWGWSLSTTRQCVCEPVPAAVEGGVGVAAAGEQEFAVVDEEYVQLGRQPAFVAIDRPAGTGKTTLTCALGERLTRGGHDLPG